MLADLARLLSETLEVVQLNGTATTEARKKLEAALFKPILVGMSLASVRSVAKKGHLAALDEVLRDATHTQLKDLSRRWNPNRGFSAQTMLDLQRELRDLVAAKREPLPNLGAFDLQQARAAFRADARGVDEALQDMEIKRLMSVSKKWDPNRKFAKQYPPTEGELRGDLLSLVRDERQPMPPPVKPSRARRGK